MIQFDSRKITNGDTFVAIVGTVSDGHDFIEKAIEKGANKIVCQKMAIQTVSGVEYIVVDDTASELARLASDFYGNPSRKLKLVGITGTNGKTTTATLLYELFTALGYKVGLLSTVVNKIAGRDVPATHTTPDPIELNGLLSEMVDAGCSFCFMEVSSHGIVQKRTEGLCFAGGVFSNLTHDHLDYHKTFAEYLKAKKSFFDNLPKSAFALTNIDDRNGEVMLQNCNATKKSYSLWKMADYKTKIIESHIDGALLEINKNEVWVKFVGRFNAYNLTAIYATAIELGEDSEEVLRIISTLEPVAGRFQTWRKDGILGVVDYAHTPDALKNVLDTISEFKAAGEIITVVGCGGDRDKTKRPIMAQIATNNSDKAILTSDNPRTEIPSEILKDMTSGLDPVERRKTLVIEDRKEAIKTAIAISQKGDIILIAGKGHENYQEINGVKHHFDDMEILKENL